MYKLYPDQKIAVEKGLDVTTAKKRDSGLLVLPTSFGKSLVVANIALETRGNTLILQPNKEILEQNRQKMTDYGYTGTGVFSASVGSKTIEKITFGTIGSVINSPESFKFFDTVVIDEAHTVNAKAGQYKELLTKHLPHASVIGLTATPFRMHPLCNKRGDPLGSTAKILTRTKPKLFKNIRYAVGINKMFERGTLCPLTYERVRYSTKGLELNSSGSNYNEKSLLANNKKNDIVGNCFDSIARHYDTRNHHLTFMSDLSSTYELVKRLNKEGITAGYVDSKQKPKERAESLIRFREGDYKVMVNVGVLTTGYDFQELDHVVDGAKTLSLPLFIQKPGRGVRIVRGADGKADWDKKSDCLYTDVVGNLDTFGRFETHRLIIPNREKPALVRWKSEVGYLTGTVLHNGYDIETKGIQNCPKLNIKKKEK